MTGTLTRIWRRTLRRYGPLGVAAAMLLMGAAVLAAWMSQLDFQGDALRARLQALTATPKIPTLQVTASPISIGQQIGDFVAAFPPLSQSAGDLNQVFQSAKKHNIQLSRGDYRLKDDAHEALLFLTATFPLNAGYEETKEFAADVLSALPHASMDELSMVRSTAGESALETSIRFSFVYRRLTK